jgi:hypothetical protein
MDDDVRDDRDGLGQPEQQLSGDEVESAVAAAEEGSAVEGVHTVPGDVDPGESRVERLAGEDDDPAGMPPNPSPS